MTAFPTVELTVYPYDCDAFGHLNQAALLTLLERARWEALARGPGMDLFDRNGVWPAARKAVIEYKAGAYPRDVLRIETTVVHRGTTSLTLRHVVRRVADDALIAEAEIVFVCVDRLGRATPLPEEIARVMGPRTHDARDFLRQGRRAAQAVDADEHNLRFRDESVIRDAPNHVAQRQAGRPAMHDRRLDPQHVAWVCSRLVLDHRLAGGGPDSIAVEQNHARAAGERHPARALPLRQTS